MRYINRHTVNSRLCKSKQNLSKNQNCRKKKQKKIKITLNRNNKNISQTAANIDSSLTLLVLSSLILLLSPTSFRSPPPRNKCPLEAAFLCLRFRLVCRSATVALLCAAATQFKFSSAGVASASVSASACVCCTTCILPPVGACGLFTSQLARVQAFHTYNRNPFPNCLSISVISRCRRRRHRRRRCCAVPIPAMRWCVAVAASND